MHRVRRIRITSNRSVFLVLVLCVAVECLHEPLGFGWAAALGLDAAFAYAEIHTHTDML